MNTKTPGSSPFHYACAVAAVLLAAAARMALGPALGGRQPFLLFYLAILGTSLYAGVGPSVVAVVLSLLAGVFLFLPPYHSLLVREPGDQVALVMYLAVAAAFIAFGAANRGARRRLEREVEERSRAEDGEREQRERLHATLASVGDAVIATDARGLVVSLNPVAEALTGWPQSEAAGVSVGEVFRVVDGETRAPAENPALRALELGAVVRLADRSCLVARDGTERPVDDSAAPIRDRGGNVVGAVLVFRDVSEARRAERQVRESEERSRLLLDSTGEAIYGIDLDGRCTFCNPACLRLLGYDAADDLLGRPMHRLIHHTRPDGTPYPDHECRIYQAFRRGEGAHVDDEVFWRADGTSFAAEYRSYPVRRDGRAVGSVVTFIDVTDRKAAEATIAEQVRLAEYGRDIAAALTRASGLREMLTRCAEVTVTHLGAAFARVWTVDEAGDTLELQASAGMYTHTDGPHGLVPVGLYKIGRIARDRTPHLTNAVIGDPSVPEQGWAAREGLVAFAGYPLVVDDRLVGVVALFARRALSPAALEMLASVADEVALGVERKRAESRLYRQREWLRVTLSSIGDAVIATDTEGRVSFQNAVAEALTGWPQSEAAGVALDDVFRIVDETTRQGVESPASRALRLGTVVGLANHTVLIARDGTERAIDDSAAPIRDESGAVMGAVLIFRDVEQRRRTERALEASEARKAAVLRSALDAIVTCDGGGKVVEWNPAAESIFGYPEADAVGRELSELIVPPASREAHLRGMGRLLATGESRILGRRIEIMAMRADGTEVPVEMALTRIRGDGPSYFTAHVRDITGRKRAEQRMGLLAEAGAVLASSLDYTETLRNIARIAAGGFADVCFFDLTAENGRVERVAWAHSDPTRQAEMDRVWGAKPPVWFGNHPGARTIASAVTEFVPRVDDDWVRREATGPEHYDYLRALDLTSIITAPVPAQGRTAGAITFCLTGPGRHFDEADVRFAEDMGRRAGVSLSNAILYRQAEEANRAKDQFLAVLSHELRTPLNPILLAATSMLERPGDPDELRPTLEMIRQNVNLQARLIDDLLDVMRIVRGKMPLHWEVADCHRLIRQAVQICRSEVFGKEVRLDTPLEALRHHVNADPARLQQVFWNLIKNAVKFTPGGGAITIRTWNEPEGGDPLGALVIEVRDTGIGIDPAVLPRIFDPFQQGETTITRKFGGLGLGLAICKGIVEAHGGGLAAESPGKDAGTTFRVALKALPEPAAEGTSGAAPGAPTAAPAHPVSLKILVVEDEPTTLRMMARLLRGLGHEVTTADTISRALETFRAGDFELVISDIGLPDGSGLDLIRRAVALRGPVPAIALTGYGMEEDIRRSREAGFTAHLTKPIDFTKLELMIHQVVPAGS